MKTITHECYVSLETAKLLKEAGFDWKCINRYIKDTEALVPCLGAANWNAAEWGINDYKSAPTLEVAQKWLREIRHRSIEVKSFVDGTVENRDKWWIWLVYNFNPPIDWMLLKCSACRYSTYEEALEAGIKKALEIIL